VTARTTADIPGCAKRQRAGADLWALSGEVSRLDGR